MSDEPARPAAPAESQARELAFLRDAARQSSIVVMEWDVPSMTLRYSEGSRELLVSWFGSVPERADDWSALVVSAAREAVDEAVGWVRAGLMPSGESYEIELPVVRADGSRRWLLARGRAVETDAEGRPLRVVSSIVDVTPLHDARMALARRNEVLEAIGRVQTMRIASDDIRSIASAMLTEVLRIGRSEIGFLAELVHDEGEAPFLRSQAISNIAWSAETRALYERAQENGLEFRNLRSLFGAVVTTGDVVVSNDPENDPRRCGLPAGHPPLRSFLGVPLKRDGRLIGTIGIANRPGGYDESVIAELEPLAGTCAQILDAHLSERERARAESALQQARRLESLGLLAGSVAHDVNNLLAAILGNLNLAQISPSLDDSARTSLDRAESAVAKARDLARQLLAYGGRTELEVGRVDLERLVRETLLVLEVSIPPTVRVSVRSTRDLPDVLGDRAQLQQVVLNLVTNACEAIGAGPGEVRIELDRVDVDDAVARRHAGFALAHVPHVRLRVVDSGCGMSSETLERIFDPFFSTKTNGRGLGLSAMLGIVRSHRGAVHVHSEPGHGAQFELLLPARPDGAEVAAPRAPDPEPVASARLSGLALVVDDEPSIRSVLERLLRSFGLDVVCAENGREALRAFSLDPGALRLVVIDVQMPVLGGREALREMRRIARVPAILVSGYDDVTQAPLPPTEDVVFLAKPFTRAMLRAAVDRVLARTKPFEPFEPDEPPDAEL